MIINTMYTIVSVIIGILINILFIFFIQDLSRGLVNPGIGTGLTIGLISIKIFKEIKEIKEKLDKLDK